MLGREKLECKKRRITDLVVGANSWWEPTTVGLDVTWGSVSDLPNIDTKGFPLRLTWPRS